MTDSVHHREKNHACGGRRHTGVKIKTGEYKRPSQISEGRYFVPIKSGPCGGRTRDTRIKRCGLAVLF